MKKVVLILLLVPAILFAQKPLKPNLNKALTSWKAGKLQEAKDMIDVCEKDPKLSLDGNTFYYKGLIYASLDTTSNPAFKSLSDNAFETAMEAFAKADQMAGKKEYFITDQTGFPLLKNQQTGYLGDYYIRLGAVCYQEDDLECALKNFEKTQRVLPNDTTAYFYAGLVANSLEDHDKSIKYMTEYIKLGGKSPDAYTVLINTYSGPKENKDKALEIAREAKAKFPTNSNFPRVEIGILIDTKREAEAKAGLEQALAKEPNDKVLHFFLGYINYKLANTAEAKASFETALKLDPTYFDAQLFLAKLFYEDAYTVKKEMNALGISEKDKKRRFELDKIYVEKLKVALPYWEQAEKMNPSDQEVLDALYSMYVDLDNQPQIKRIEKRYKELGMDN